MNVKPQTESGKLKVSIDPKIDQATDPEEILCTHCQRTATNGIKCQGICASDS